VEFSLWSSKVCRVLTSIAHHANEDRWGFEVFVIALSHEATEGNEGAWVKSWAEFTVHRSIGID